MRASSEPPRACRACEEGLVELLLSLAAGVLVGRPAGGGVRLAKVRRLLKAVSRTDARKVQAFVVRRDLTEVTILGREPSHIDALVEYVFAGQVSDCLLDRTPQRRLLLRHDFPSINR
jgi:hypothetical protein